MAEELRYEKLAGELAGMIADGVLACGDRLPSVRRLAEERRLSYAERRRLRMLERQKPIEVPKPTYTGEALEKHLQEYQMEILRGGTMPPLPVQLSPENDAKLVEEGVLPPVDEEGYEVLPDEGEAGEYYEE